VTQPRERLPLGDATDLTQVDGNPSPSADRAYERWQSDVHLEGETRLPFGSAARFLLDAGERSRLVTVLAYSIAALLGLVTAFTLHTAVDLQPGWSTAGGGLVWSVVSGLLHIHHRRRRR
jgi:hypothetical protein